MTWRYPQTDEYVPYSGEPAANQTRLESGGGGALKFNTRLAHFGDFMIDSFVLSVKPSIMCDEDGTFHSADLMVTVRPLLVKVLFIRRKKFLSLCCFLPKP